METNRSWTSPDGKIQKYIVVEGVWGKKPSEQSECDIELTDCDDDLKQFNGSVIVGHNDGDFGRFLDRCLICMNEGEIASFQIVQPPISFTLNLKKLTFNGLIYEWDAKKKYEIALNHKNRGVELFKQNRSKDAACRFSKALKIISSIPIDVEETPEEIDGVTIKDISQLKANLFSNLATYHLKRQAWLTVIDVCKKVFNFDNNNVKAHYKIGVAYMKDRNWELAEKSFEIVLKSEPDNKAAIENLKFVREEIKKANLKVNNMIKKMFA